MEVGPTCHYVMGGIQVDPDTAAAARVPGLFACGEVAGGMHGSNRLGGNSLSDLLVFGRRAGLGAAAYVDGLGDEVPTPTAGSVEAAARTALAPFDREDGENPYTLHRELQQAMNDLVGIIRREPEIEQAIETLEALKPRVAAVSVEGHRQFNPGWHLALDLVNMLQVSECVARAALLRQESRGGHTRDDYPTMSADWRRRLLICAMNGSGAIDVVQEPITPIRSDLLALFERTELDKYLTAEELPAESQEAGHGA
jgi:succinate dehydrogenase / fumarate reductase flavoprotein subunit